ncbi:MAG: hypothetical protein HZC28_13205 [Spirochaetes bacterium]|nr:hypothetical protein [Spirochaetota bacterium]
MKATLLAERCPAQNVMCKPAVECPAKAIVYHKDESLPLGGKITINSEQCNGCGICVTLCCGNAIALE